MRLEARPLLRPIPTQFLRHRSLHSGRSCGLSQAPSRAPRHVFIAEPSEVHSAYARYVQMNAPEISAKCSRPQGKDCMSLPPHGCFRFRPAYHFHFQLQFLTAAYLSISLLHVNLPSLQLASLTLQPKNESIKVFGGLAYGL